MPGHLYFSGDRGMKNGLQTSGDQWPGLKRRGLTVMEPGHAKARSFWIFVEINQQDFYTSFLVRARLAIAGFGQLFM